LIRRETRRKGKECYREGPHSDAKVKRREDQKRSAYHRKGTEGSALNVQAKEMKRPMGKAERFKSTQSKGTAGTAIL